MKKYFSLESFSFAFDSKQHYFFENTSCEVLQPGLNFLIGKNGAGKSTFFRLMQGIIGNSEVIKGKVTIQDHRYDFENLQDRKKLHARSMILHQNFDSMLAPSFTGYQNLQYSTFNINPNLDLITDSYDVIDFVKSFSIPLDKPVHLLSGGQRQMLAMLMVTQKPLDILLLDEPTAALDSKNSDYVMKGIENIAREKNILVLCISHDQDIIDKYSKNKIEIMFDQDDKRQFVTL